MSASSRSSPRTCASCSPRRSARRWPLADGDPREPAPLRTLVVSDLHLGARRGRSVLDDPRARDALLGAVAAADRLVLLGDVIELREGRPGDALASAAVPLRRIAEALGPDAPVVLVAGNHDHGLVASWLARRDGTVTLGSAAAVTPEPGGPLAELVGELGAERTSVAYPGAWLREDVWATHGHYADRHTTVPMLERIAAGVMARIVREAPGGPARAEDYEAALAPMYAWLDVLAASGRARAGGVSAGAWRALAGADGARRGGAAGLRRRAAAAAFPALVAALNRAGLGPLRPDLTRGALRRGALAAIGEVTARLGVSAAHVVFGHTHRAGPLPGDDAAEWRAGPARLHNCGCWVRETSLAGPDPARSPYRAGFALWVEAELARAPELVNLLD